MDEAELRKRVEIALETFRQVDRHLLENDLSERCIAARVAFHLHNMMTDSPELSVDVEYNRKGIDKKRLPLPDPCFNKRDEDGNSIVLPDLIVHQRGADGPNLLVLEFKKTSNRAGNDCDRIRLLAFRDVLKYSVGGLVECETRPNREPRISVVEWL